MDQEFNNVQQCDLSVARARDAPPTILPGKSLTDGTPTRRTRRCEPTRTTDAPSVASETKTKNNVRFSALRRGEEYRAESKFLGATLNI